MEIFRSSLTAIAGDGTRDIVSATTQLGVEKRIAGAKINPWRSGQAWPLAQVAADAFYL